MNLITSWSDRMVKRREARQIGGDWYRGREDGLNELHAS